MRAKERIRWRGSTTKVTEALFQKEGVLFLFASDRYGFPETQARQQSPKKKQYLVHIQEDMVFSALFFCFGTQVAIYSWACKNGRSLRRGGRLTKKDKIERSFQP